MSKWTRFANLWRDHRLDAEFEEELRFHFDMRVQANLRAGLSETDARTEAHRHLGRAAYIKEGMREARVMTWLEALARDLWHGGRSFLRQPGTTALALLTLSLGIGANAAIFSLVHAVLLRPLPFPDAGRLVVVDDHFRAQGPEAMGPTVPELLDLRDRTTTLDTVSFFDMRDVQVNGGNKPARAFAARVDGSFLSVLGVRPALGRLFVAADNTPGQDRVVILTDGFWQRNFGGDPAAVGKSITVNGVPSTIVGVLPETFHFDYFSGDPIELYVPFTMSEAYTSRAAEFVNVRRVFAVARLAEGVTIDATGAEVEAISASIASEHSALYRRGSDGRELGFVMQLEPLRRAVAAGRPVLLLLSAAVGLVLLIACANTAQFLLARAVERRQEVAVRSALGASRGRLVRQFMAESLLLALLAAVAGLVQAGWLLELLGGPLATRARLVGGLGIDGPVIGFTLAIAVITTMTFGLLPALHFARVQPLGGIDLRGTGGVRTRTRQILIACEVAVSLVLLVSAAAVVRGLIELQFAPGGYSADDVTVMRMRASAPGSGGGPTGRLYQRYLEAVGSVPGVSAAAVASAPLPGSAGIPFSVVGGPDDAATLSRQRASWRITSPEYFSVMSIPLREGRTFTPEDVTGRTPVAIVDESLARQFFPGETALGQQIRSGEGPRAAVATIVGVVGDVRPPHLASTMPQIYVSYLQQSEPNTTLLVRSPAGAALPIEAIKQAIWSVSPDQPVFDIQPMSDVVARSTAQPRLIAQLLGGFALLALLMSIAGVYMIVSYMIAGRAKEVAVRRAIGAESFDVLKLLAGQTVRWTLAGLMVGIGGAIAVSGALRAALTDLGRLDFLTVGAVSALYLVIVVLAVFIPAARALGLDPAAVLRAE